MDVFIFEKKSIQERSVNEMKTTMKTVFLCRPIILPLLMLSDNEI